MKRMSKAEEAISKQLEELRSRILNEEAAMEGQKLKIRTLCEVADELQDAILDMRSKREQASERNSSHGQ